MLYILYGSDTFRRDEKLREILAAYKEKHPQELGLEKLDSDTTDVSSLSRALESTSLFEAMRLVVARNFIARYPKELGEFLAGQRIADDRARVLVLQEDILGDECMDFLKLAKVQRFDPLHSQKLYAWIVARVAERGLTQGPSLISDEAARYVAVYARDLWEAANVIDQAIVAAAGKPKLELGDFVPFLVRRSEEKVFPAGDALARRDGASVLSEVEKLASQGEDAAQLSGFLLSAMRNIYRGFVGRGESKKSEELAKTFGMHPYVARKAYEASRYWDENKIRTALDSAARLDYRRKLSRIPPRLALDAFVLRATNAL